MRQITGSLALVSLIACAAQVLGQFPPGGGQPGGGFGGPGGGGFGGQPGGGGFGGQPGGGGFGRPGGGGMGGGGMNFDPNAIAGMMFDRAAGGKPTMTISAYSSGRDPEASARLAAWATKNGITSGQVTREQFSAFFKERITDMQAQGGMRMGGAPGGPPVGMTITAGGPDSNGQPQMQMQFGGGGGGGWGGGFNVEEMAKNRFAEVDANKNGFIDDAELVSPLKDALAFVDTDKDGKVNLPEFTEFMKQQMGSGGFGGAFNIPVPESEKKTAVYRVGKLPKELPEWFEKLDTDKDAQVGLYEWKKGGKPVQEFREIDESSDGLITVDEALIPTRIAARKKQIAESPGLVGALPAGSASPYQQSGGWGGGQPSGGRGMRGMGGPGGAPGEAGGRGGPGMGGPGGAPGEAGGRGMRGAGGPGGAPGEAGGRGMRGAGGPGGAPGEAGGRGMRGAGGPGSAPGEGGGRGMRGAGGTGGPGGETSGKSGRGGRGMAPGASGTVPEAKR